MKRYQGKLTDSFLNTFGSGALFLANPTRSRIVDRRQGRRTFPSVDETRRPSNDVVAGLSSSPVASSRSWLASTLALIALNDLARRASTRCTSSESYLIPSRRFRGGEDEQAKKIMENIGEHGDYFMQDDLLMKKSSPPVPFIPRGRIRADIIKIYHDTPANGAHFGRDRTIEKIQQRYFWPKMITDIRNHLKTCLPCLQNNHQRQKPPGFLKPIKPPEGIWQLLTMDFRGPISPTTKNGNKYIIAITDVLSKFVITKAVRDCTAATAAHFFVEEVILKYGTPKSILTDNGT